MRFFNLLGNKFFSLAFSWLLGQSIKDTLCGTKVLSRSQYETIAANRAWFGEFDPFGDFDLIFGAAKFNLKIVDMPVRYGERTYGETNIQRWRHGVVAAADGDGGDAADPVYLRAFARRRTQWRIELVARGTDVFESLPTAIRPRRRSKRMDL